MTSAAPKAPTLVDALTGMPINTHPATGKRYAAKPSRPHSWARALDSAIVITAAIILMVTLRAQAANYALGTALSEALLSNGLIMFAAMVGVWFATIFLYGMICGSPVGSIGDQAFGVRTVRITDGTRPGALLGGWRAVCWSAIPLVVIIWVTSLITDSGNYWDDPFRDSRFVGEDTRSGLARGIEPVEESTPPGE